MNRTLAGEATVRLEEDFCLLISQYSDKVLQRAVLLTDELSDEEKKYPRSSTTTTTTTATLRLPIHLACDNDAPVSIIRTLLEADRKNQTILQPDKWGDLPIHTACSRKNNLEVIQLLLEADTQKQTLHVKDVHESLPLHMAARYNAPPAVIRLLLENDKNRNTDQFSLYQEGIYGQYPLTVACRGDLASSEMLQVLLDYDTDKRSTMKVDETGRLPIHVLMLRNTDVSCIKLLLEGMIQGRIFRVGLQNWKHDLVDIIKAMNDTYERDFSTRDKLDIIEKELDLFVHKAVLLELAVWKASCLIGSRDDNNLSDDQANLSFCSSTLKEILDCAALKSSTDVPFSADDYKHERHVKSGAEMILPGVFSFLENEPIDRTIEEFQSLGYATTNNNPPNSTNTEPTDNNSAASTATPPRLFP